MRSYKYLYNYKSTAYYYIYKRNVRLNIVIYIKRIIIFNVSSMNSKQSKLCVNSSRNIDTRLLWKAAVCGDCTQEIDDKIIKAPVP